MHRHVTPQGVSGRQFDASQQPEEVERHDLQAFGHLVGNVASLSWKMTKRIKNVCVLSSRNVFMVALT